jgi:hypothetical protein
MLEAPPPKVEDKGEATEVNLSAAEVDEWLNIFGDGDNPKDKKKKR